MGRGQAVKVRGLLSHTAALPLSHMAALPLSAQPADARCAITNS